MVSVFQFAFSDSKKPISLIKQKKSYILINKYNFNPEVQVKIEFST